MARSPKNHNAAAEFGERLHALNVERDQPTSKDIELWIYDAFHTRVSQESIRKAHRGEVDPTACDLELITGLAAYYDVEVTDLGPHAARRTLTVITMAYPKLAQNYRPESTVRRREINSPCLTSQRSENLRRSVQTRRSTCTLRPDPIHTPCASARHRCVYIHTHRGAWAERSNR